MLAIDAFRHDAWTRQDPRLPNDLPTLTPHWHRDHALRTGYARRQPSSKSTSWRQKRSAKTLAELQAIYRVQLPAMRQYEAETHYDTNGRIVFTPSKGLPCVSLPRKAVKGDTGCALTAPEGPREGIALGWEDVRNPPEGTIAARSPTTTARTTPSSAGPCMMHPSTTVYTTPTPREPTSTRSSIVTDTCIWTGSTGRQYNYRVFLLPVSFQSALGNYIYCRLASNGWIPIYIGEGDLSERVGDNHHQIYCIKAKGATHVHAHATNSKSASQREETDLLGRYTNAYKPTGCNEKLGG